MGVPDSKLGRVVLISNEIKNQTLIVFANLKQGRMHGKVLALLLHSSNESCLEVVQATLKHNGTFAVGAYQHDKRDKTEIFQLKMQTKSTDSLVQKVDNTLNLLDRYSNWKVERLTVDDTRAVNLLQIHYQHSRFDGTDRVLRLNVDVFEKSKQSAK